ncbi:MAG: ferrous iron transport protein A [Ruminococcus sp.]|nr:ferrous iron transport protein A [Ruminococcus sp.]MBP3379584.1 ferrous iron transport protein A [Ruminococcus sp.]
MTLKDGVDGQEYIIKKINADDEELISFLFSLGCYSGEKITLISRRNSGYVVSIKDARYNIDKQLADAIEV